MHDVDVDRVHVYVHEVAAAASGVDVYVHFRLGVLTQHTSVYREVDCATEVPTDRSDESHAIVKGRYGGRFRRGR